MNGRFRRPRRVGLLVGVLALMIPGAPGVSGQESGLYPGTVNLVPAIVAGVSNCVPLANNVLNQFTGFIYSNVAPFHMREGDRFAFDLGGFTNEDVRRNIYFAAADRNPFFGPGGTGVSALGWTQVASDSQVPESPRGNQVVGDYELVFRAEAGFDFPGGGFIVGFGGSPPGEYADPGCEQVMVHTTRADPSGHFYARFYRKADQTLGILDTNGSDGMFLAGIVIHTSPAEPAPTVVVEVDVRPGSPEKVVNPRAARVDVAVLSSEDLDVTAADPATLRFGATGTEASLVGCGKPRDTNRDGLPDLVCAFDPRVAALSPGTTEVALSGVAGGVEFAGSSTVRLLP